MLLARDRPLILNVAIRGDTTMNHIVNLYFQSNLSGKFTSHSLVGIFHGYYMKLLYFDQSICFRTIALYVHVSLAKHFSLEALFVVLHPFRRKLRWRCPYLIYRSLLLLLKYLWFQVMEYCCNWVQQRVGHIESFSEYLSP